MYEKSKFLSFKQNEEDSNGIKEIVSKCKNGYKLNLILLKFGIKQPYDENDIINAEKLGLKVEDYFNTENDGPYCYSYQCVAEKTSFGHTDQKKLQHIEALLHPSIDVIEAKLPENFSMGLKWEIDEKAGKLENVNTLVYDKANPQNKDKIITPPHTPPDNIKGDSIKDDFLSLKFFIKENDDEILSFSDSKKIEVFKDHLARDVENFKNGKACIRKNGKAGIELKDGTLVEGIQLGCVSSLSHDCEGFKGDGKKLWKRLREDEGWSENNTKQENYIGTKDDLFRTEGYRWQNWKDNNGIEHEGFLNIILYRGDKIFLGDPQKPDRHPVTVISTNENQTGSNSKTFAGDTVDEKFRHEKVEEYFNMLDRKGIGIDIPKRRLWVLSSPENNPQ